MDKNFKINTAGLSTEKFFLLSTERLVVVLLLQVK